MAFTQFSSKAGGSNCPTIWASNVTPISSQRPGARAMNSSTIPFNLSRRWVRMSTVKTTLPGMMLREFG
jgi:hypothetical protein